MTSLSNSVESGRPKAGTRIETVRVRWYLRSTSDPVPPPVWTQLCARYFREGTPGRFGQTEPLRKKFDDEAFHAEWQTARRNVHFTGANTLIYGSLPSAKDQERHLSSITLSLAPQTIDDVFTARLLDFFVAVADAYSAFYASAEVIRGSIAGRRGVLSDSETETVVVPLRRSNWFGLPPYPVTLAWYGAPYVPLVRENLSGGTVHVHRDGLVHQLSSSLDAREHIGDGDEWVDPNLRCVVQPNDGRTQPLPITPARERPDLAPLK